MAALSRRRRFVILLFICCMSYFLFSWYIKEDVSNINGNFLTDVGIDDSTTYIINEDPLSKESGEKALKPTDSYSEFFIPSSETSSIIPNKTPSSGASDRSKTISEIKNSLLKLLKKTKKRPPNLFSFKSDGSFNPELEPSGPTEEEEFSDKPSTSSMSTVTTANNLQTGVDYELESGPADSKLGPTKPPTAPQHHDDSKGLLDTQTSRKHESTLPFNNLNFTKPTKNPALIIDTPGCKIPKMDPFDPTVKEFIEIKDYSLCPDIPLFMTPEPHGIIHLNVSVLEKYYNATPDDMECWYQAIIRKHEDPGNVRENDYRTTEVTELKFDVPMEHEYIAAKCFFRDNRTFEQYLPLVKLKKEIEEERSKIENHPPLNVILLGIDSVSKLNFMRHFRKTKAFLKEKMKPFDMKGYTKVGDNTFPNLVPLLTGHFVEYYWNESVRDTFIFDNIGLIWKDYAQNGYRTLYAEDSPYTGTFNYIKRGFHDPPTDYYYRPLALAIEQSDLRKQNKDSPCLNSELETELMYDYLKNFVRTMDDKPYFAFVMVSTLTHDYLNSASYADPPAAKILEELHNNGALNKSALVIFSDHGLRFGAIRHTYIGKFEERMPFMYIHFPQWFLNQHPEFEKNLNINEDRLITLFDIHATMKHLLTLNGATLPEKDDIGLSLLNEIPDSRTCDDASILQHWCPCNSFDPVPVNDPAVVNVSQALVDHINELLKPHEDICAHLEVDEVTDARLGLPNIVVLKFQRHENVVENRTVILGEEPPTLGDYLITLTAKPGGAIFEGTIRYDDAKAESHVMGISRINMYGNQSVCINSQKLKIYCFCK